MHKIFFKAFITCMSVFIVTTNVDARMIDLPSFSPLVKKAGPAVVNISTERTVKQRNLGGGFSGLPKEMERFFKEFDPFMGEQGGGGRERTQSSLGSGFIISKDGYIVTNNHVVDGADKIFVTFDDRGTRVDSVEAKIVGKDPDTDIALLKINVDDDLPVLQFGDSDALDVGEWVVAIGNPFGLSSTVTAGIVSAKGRNIHAGPFDNFLQTDASINPGNSGGPLINMEGEVVGINTAISATGQGIGFAIPSALAKNVVEQLKTGKTVSRGWIGVTIQDVDEMSAKALGLKKASGALIGSVMTGAPAEKAGLRSGDIIIRVDRTKIKSASDLTKSIAGKKPGSDVNMEVIRNGKSKKFTIILGDRAKGLNSAVPQEKTEKIILGVSLRPMTTEEALSLQIPADVKGLLVMDVQRDGLAARYGVRAGDVIVAANLKPVDSVEDLGRIINQEAKTRGAVILQVIRQSNTFLVSIPLE